METLSTTMDSLTTDLSSLQLPTAATLATLSLEVPLPGSVCVEVVGMGQLQLAKVPNLVLAKWYVVFCTFMTCTQFMSNAACSCFPLTTKVLFNK